MNKALKIIKVSFDFSKVYFIIQIILMILQIINNIILILLPKYLFDFNNINYIKNVSIIFIGLFILNSIINIIKCKRDKQDIYMEHYFKDTISDTIFDLDYSFLENKQHQDKLAIANWILQVIQISTMLEIISSFLVSLISIITVSYLFSSKHILLLVVFILLLIIRFYFLKQNRIQQISFQKDMLIQNRIYGVYVRLMNDFTYGKDIRLLGIKSYIKDKFLKQIDKSNIIMNNMANKTLINDCIISFIDRLAMLIIYLYMIIQAYQGSLSFSELMLYINGMIILDTSMSSIVNLYNRFMRIMSNYGYLFDILDMKNHNHKNETSNNDKETTEDITTIEFKNVSFIYPGTNHPTLKNVNVTINKNDILTIVGQNGAGKTTFVKLLLGLYSPTTGSILINGRNLEELDKKNYMETFKAVFQDYKILPVSLKENITLNNNKQDSKSIHSVLEKLDLASVVDDLKQKEETILSKRFKEDGTDLSGGQAQKVAIGRALYSDSEIIIFDEPTAALDAISEYHVFTNIYESFKDRTIIFVTHRLSSCLDSDKILLFDDGCLIEEGSHQVLMSKKGEYYRQFDKQAKALNKE